MNSPCRSAAGRLGGIDPTMFGLALSFVSAALYAVTNVCLKSSTGQPDIWVTCLKTAPTAIVAALLLALNRRNAPLQWPAWPVLAALVVTGLVSQWGGNVAFQYGLRTVGLAIAPPVAFGMLMICGALLGRAWLDEPITAGAAVGIAILIASIALLKLGARGGDTTAAALAIGQDSIILGIAAVCLAGFSYALLGAVIRWATLRRVPTSLSVCVVGLVGLVTLGAASAGVVGIDGLLATPRNDFLVMLAGGVCNTLAFLALAKAFELAPVSRVNAVNSSQVAMSSVAGVLLFGEPASYYLGLGIVLLIAGLWLINRRHVPDEV